MYKLELAEGRSLGDLELADANEMFVCVLENKYFREEI